MIRSLCAIAALSALVGGLSIPESESVRDNEILETPRVESGDQLLDSVIGDCFSAESTIGCLKVKVLAYLDTRLGVSAESARTLEGARIDEAIFERVGRLVAGNEFRVRLPEFLFQGAEVSYRADRGLDVDFPEDSEDNGEARGILKKKLLLPVLLLLKLKLKALMPIVVALVGVKALKALILSKLAITLVVGFLIYNLLLKKGGMPMAMMPAEPPAPQYGPPANAYGAPASTPAAPADSYNPHWEPSSSGPYARVWDPSQLAYSSYYPGDSAAVSPSSGYSSVSSVSSASSSSSSPKY